jgi:hypothetical protein
VGCPRKQAYIATSDGGYVSASDIEDKDIFEANIVVKNNDSTNEEVLTTAMTEKYITFILQRAFSAKV